LPKLFRRCTDYLKAVDRGFEGNLSDWLIAHTEGSRLENDQLLLPGNVEVRLSDVMQQRNNQIIFQPDVLDIVFIEK